MLGLDAENMLHPAANTGVSAYLAVPRTKEDNQASRY